ncbi:852_t:CDS:1 [Paraglomus occultum]|uniref:852_t:CDS:1 n=1 Tax=Paraglomus occultum TaxID=144539 RepID=A0A9N9B7P1_9GLOM|nr:852_t:CDS:1 [Paraglomus occultum]
MFPLLPLELYLKIASYIDEDDIPTLYSCILVNRQSFFSYISILWRKPFHIAHRLPRYKVVNLVKVCISTFTADEKRQLSTRSIRFPTQSSTPLINYIKFIECVSDAYIIKALMYFPGVSTIELWKVLIEKLVNDAAKIKCLEIQNFALYWSCMQLDQTLFKMREVKVLKVKRITREQVKILTKFVAIQNSLGEAFFGEVYTGIGEIIEALESYRERKGSLYKVGFRNCNFLRNAYACDVMRFFKMMDNVLLNACSGLDYEMMRKLKCKMKDNLNIDNISLYDTYSIFWC